MSLSRSREHRLMAGVCGGLAEQAGWSPTRLRLVWIIATIFTAFAGVIVYLGLWFLMPRAPRSFAAAPLQPWKH